MKKMSTLLICMMMYASYAQNVGIGTKNPQNKLHVAGGLRIDSLSSKKDSGLILHNKTGDVFSVGLTGNRSDVLRGDGTFAAAAAATDAWLLGGNAGTDSAVNFLGTTDNKPMMLRINNERFGRIHYYNIAIGRHALNNIVFAVNNVAIGDLAMDSATGGNNTAVGARAMSGSRTQFSGRPQMHDNTAIGNNALREMNYGLRNTAVGAGALENNVESFNNTAIGYRSMFNYTKQPLMDFANNTAVGTFSQFSNKTGHSNTSVGFQSLYSSESAIGLTAVGSRALYSNTEGQFNTAIGYFSLFQNETGHYNTAVGSSALFGNVDGTFNTAVGMGAISSATSAYGLTAVGQGALGSTTTGLYNTAIGKAALSGNTEGSNNTAGGYDALIQNTTASNNTGFGYSVLSKNLTGKENTAVGSFVLYRNVAERNSGVGYKVLFNNTSGVNNTAFGFQSMLENMTGSSNTAAGFQALWRNTSGQNNTGFGYGALQTNTTGTLNTAVGMYADVSAGNLTNATAIGYRATVNASNKVRIGNASVTVIEGQVPFTTPSDGRFKYNVKEDVGGLDFILKLRPVTYQFDVKKFDKVSFASATEEAYEKAALIRRTGFIAQEVEKAAQETHYNFSGVIRPESMKEHYSLSYESFVVPLVKAVQEQHEIITSQDKKINKLMETVEKQQQLIDQLLKQPQNKKQ